MALTTAPAARAAVLGRRWSWWAGAACLGLVALLVTVRVFTERLALLPRLFNGADLALAPLLLLVAAARLARQRAAPREVGVLALAGVFGLVWGVSWWLNRSDVHWLGALLMLAGLLAPVAFYLAVVNLGLERRFVGQALALLDGLLIANLLLGTFDALVGMGGGADFVFGTFGVNQNQMGFFLAWQVAYRLARLRFLPFRRLDLALLLWSGALFMLCSFQTLWILLPLIALAVLALCGRPPRHLVASCVLLCVVAVAAANLVPFRRLDAGQIARDSVTHFGAIAKVQLARQVPEIWGWSPWAAWWGVGPGTLNSRAFRAIAVLPERGGATDVAASVLAPFYRSDVAEQHVLPLLRGDAEPLGGSNIEAPFSSYLSVPLETGLLGAAALFGLYGLGLLQAARAVRRGAHAHARALAAWALMSLLLLLGAALVDNYLEVTRLTLPVWLSLALWRLEACAGPPPKTDTIRPG